MRPLRCELKVRDFEAFKAHYCALCHTLAKRYGFRTRFLLQYDLLFFAFTQSLSTPPPGFTGRRCPLHPFKRRCQACSDPSLDAAADLTVLLCDVKVKDTLADEKGLKRLSARLLGALMRRPVKKARAARAQWARATDEMRETLARVERKRLPSLDAPAHVFASFMSGLSAAAPDEPLSRLYYHAGRWIYLIDAVDDLEADLRKHRFNPVALRFGLERPPRVGGAEPFLTQVMTEEQRSLLALTLAASRREMEEASSQLPEHPAMALVGNTVYCGLPAVERLVWQGQWRKKQSKNLPEPRREVPGASKEKQI